MLTTRDGRWPSWRTLVPLALAAAVAVAGVLYALQHSTEPNEDFWWPPEEEAGSAPPEGAAGPGLPWTEAAARSTTLRVLQDAARRQGGGRPAEVRVTNQRAGGSTT